MIKRISTLVLFLALTVGIAEAQTFKDYIRFKEGNRANTGKLQIAVEKFTKGVVEVHLYGVVHMADKDYYKEVQKDLDKYDIVLYEGIRQGAKPNAETQVLNLFQAGMAKLMGLQFQKDGISYEGANMVHADIDAEALERGLDGQKLTPFGELLNQEELKKLKPVLKQAGFALEIFMLQNPEIRRDMKFNFAKQLSGTDIEEQLPPQLKKVIIVDRNKIVMEKLRIALFDRNVRKIAIFYGAGHNADFAKRLMKLGWKRGDKVWKTAWDIK